MSKDPIVVSGLFALCLTVFVFPEGRQDGVEMNQDSVVLNAKEEHCCGHEVLTHGDGEMLVPTEKSLQQPDPRLADQSENEIPFPAEDCWRERDGLEYQLTTSTPVVQTTAKSLVYYIWIRNPRSESKSVRVVSHPSFLPHFDLQVTSENGESMLVGKCLKKHDYKTIGISPGQVRGFRVDAFEGWCRRLESLPENPTSFTLGYRGAKLRVQTRLLKD